MNHPIAGWEGHTTRSGAKFLRRLTWVEEDHAGYQDWEYRCAVCDRYLGGGSTAGSHFRRKHQP